MIDFISGGSAFPTLPQLVLYVSHSVVRKACFREIHVRDSSDQIVGATVVASHAGEIVSELTMAMVGNLGLSRIARIARTIHPYPRLKGFD
jgi:pyruvate/2-oxoglutarate dehydrogenase complex dihydrolipoamide dehydrogenase (E3) component